MQQIKIAFIGAGNMATCLIGGLLKEGIPSENIIASDVNEQACATLQARFSIQTTNQNQQAIEKADLVVLAIKPQILQQVCEQLAPTLVSNSPLILSIAAGIRTSDLQYWLGGQIPLIRAMPNTPAMIQAGATALYASQEVSQTQKDQAEALMRTTGLTLWVDDETQMDTVTALSGSGPAYYFLFMEIFQKTAEDLGLDAKTAHLLTLQTALGAAKMALESQDSPAVLRQKVTSPKGTTESAIQSMLDNGIETVLKNALIAAKERSVTLSKELGVAK